MLVAASPQQAENKAVKRHSSSFKSSEEKYDNSSKTVPEEYKQLVHKQHFHYSRARNSGIESTSWFVCHKKFRRHCDKDLPVICPVDDCFQKGPDYRKKRVADASSHYDDDIARRIAKWGKRLQVQMKLEVFHSIDPISIFSFLFAFKLVFDTNRVHEGAVPWLSHFFKKHPIATAFNSRIAL